MYLLLAPLYQILSQQPAPVTHVSVQWCCVMMISYAYQFDISTIEGREIPGEGVDCKCLIPEGRQGMQKHL